MDLGDKTVARSMTIIMAVVFAVLQTLEGMGVIPPGALQELAVVGKGLAGLLAVFGLRRAIGANGVPIFRDEVEDSYSYVDDELDEDYELTDEELAGDEDAGDEDADFQDQRDAGLSL